MYLCFPIKKLEKFTKNVKIEKCYLYQNLTDTDSASIFFVFICDLNCSVSKEKARNIIFEVLLKSKKFLIVLIYRLNFMTNLIVQMKN